ncbi:uncharacterized protein LOC142587093 [Dermacentor variabilis]|uniref:uncharacterized protein LOC142587093 n=1 Tax=Dermacentor variabilis TaxID=34621 RepID=UPI003F5B3941
MSNLLLFAGRIVQKNGVLYTDQDCPRPRCPRPQRLVCPNPRDTCSCYCQDVPCYMPRCGSDCQVSCLRRTGWCECKCVPRSQRCADTWSSTCLAVCTGCNPCKCNCVGEYQQHQRNEYKSIG